ncbi:MAG: DUF4142 domain-containing protein [Acidobacteriota bacterium]|nr:DUF4142 domain-containing protein [Acidobacteriota bacterium]
MRIQRLLLTTAVTAGLCAAQQGTATTDSTTLQNQRLRGTSAQTGATTANGTHNADSVTPTLLDYGTGTDQGNSGHFVTMSDKQFATMLASRSLLEIQLGNIAAERGTTDAVKQVGREMSVEYTKWSTGITKAAAGLGLKLPTELDARHQATFDRISALNGPEFDAAYLKEMVTLQNKALTIAQYEAANAGVAGFRHWAGVMVPIIQSQLKDARQAMAGSTVAKK